MLKLACFWQPNIPDAIDFAVQAVASIRLIGVAQSAAILLLGLLAVRSRRTAPDGKLIVAAMIAGFWLFHAAAHIIARYRDRPFHS